jgi:hypothetical protein
VIQEIFGLAPIFLEWPVTPAGFDIFGLPSSQGMKLAADFQPLYWKRRPIMSEDMVKRVIARVDEMSRAGEEFEDKDLEEFAITIRHLLKERTRREEILAIAAAILALDEHKKSLENKVGYAKVGGLREREATLLEILDQIDKELEMAVTMKIHEHTHQENIADELKTAILEHLAPTLGRGKWHAREQEALTQIVSKALKGYLVVKA